MHERYIVHAPELGHDACLDEYVDDLAEIFVGPRHVVLSQATGAATTLTDGLAALKVCVHATKSTIAPPNVPRLLMLAYLKKKKKKKKKKTQRKNNTIKKKKKNPQKRRGLSQS
eukprot:NODE_27461_length_513_cov_1.564767.p1 GENE.NODE_27461_length_513_cov_1.564767~~NODE_27461_length_513_cov_1.564767.p1  ORF type:complete len:114 (-),score=38.01 NODE_27461_length_513_cov_1.564767:52-393(-)